MKELRFALLAAAAGAIALVALVHRGDPAARYPVTIDRTQAIGRARQISEKYGVKTAGWRTSVTTVTDDKLRDYRDAFPDDPAGRLFAPLGWGVLFTAPDGRLVRMRLAGDGRPLQWEYRKRGGSTPLQAPSLAPNRILAEFAGDAGAQFRAVESPAQSKVERQFREWSAGPRFPLVAQFEISSTAGEEYSVTLDQRYEQGFQRPAERSAFKAARVAVAVLHFLGFCAGLLWCFAGWSRGAFTWRAPVGLAVAAAAWIGLGVAGGPALQDLRYQGAAKIAVRLPPEARPQSGVVVTDTDPSAGGYFGTTIAPWIALFAFGGAACTFSRGRFRRKWESAELLLRGKIFSRQVARPAAIGGLCGVAVAAVPYLAARIFPGSLSLGPTGVLSAPAPPLELFYPNAVLPALGFLGFIWPWANQMRRRYLGLAILAIAAIDFVLGPLASFESAPAGVAAGLISTAAWFLIYQRFDLLAAVSGMLAARAVLAPALLLSQPVASLRETGVYLLAILGAIAALCLYHAVRGRDLAEEGAGGLLAGELTETGLARARSSRERLEAEFQVARQAQRDALPAAAPAVEGYSLAGFCEPAKQVGGDLYDYFPLPDGRLGIAVADVSGKGVPAALYMMVTKGLLTAAAQDSHDLAHIFQGINAHLFRACKRKVFVTMAALAVEPGGRRVEYARAGHNPIIWRRTRRGETLMVKPSGLGLGLCGSDQFARSLRLERMELEPGDAVVLYSDGITEAINANYDQFGEDRLIRSVEQTDGQPAEETRAAILSDLAAFTGTTPARDDVTLVALRVADSP